MDVELERMTRRQEALLRNLYQFYLYDFSEFMGWSVSREGQFSASDLDGCWDDPGRHQFLLHVDGQPAGFVLVDRLRRSAVTQREQVIEMREFFVLRAYRRRGAGRLAATRAFDLFRGVWEVYELRQNTAAQAFWRKVIGQYTGGRYEERDWSRSGASGVMQTFDNTAFDIPAGSGYTGG